MSSSQPAGGFLGFLGHALGVPASPPELSERLYEDCSAELPRGAEEEPCQAILSGLEPSQHGSRSQQILPCAQEPNGLGSDPVAQDSSSIVLLSLPEAPAGMGGEDDTWRPSRAALGRFKVVAYGTGHMLNDLTSACWFTYLLIFLTDIGLSPQQAASVLMAGQLADAFATLLAGRMIDSFGNFKLWHLGGSICTVFSFSFVFGACLVCSITNTSSSSLQALSYSFFAAVFNIGWAATQVSHMAMVNCMTCHPSSRVALNSCRNAFTMIANLTLYALAFLAFWQLPAHSPEAVRLQFRWIAAGTLGIGCLFVLIFQLGVTEPRPQKHIRSCRRMRRQAWMHWFKQRQYYQVAAIYTLTRLVCNVSQAILPFFIVRDLNMHQSAKAVIPAVVYLFSFLVSITLQELNWNSFRLKLSFSLGTLLWIFTSLLVYYIDYQQCRLLYGLAAVMGAASALVLVSATSMEGVLVGQRIDGCAFVYGSLSFLDKITSGVALFTVEWYNSPGPFCGSISDSCPRSLVRWLLTLLPLICTTLATLIAVNTHFEETESVHQRDMDGLPSAEPGIVRQVRSPTCPLDNTESSIQILPCPAQSIILPSGGPGDFAPNLTEPLLRREQIAVPAPSVRTLK